MARAARTDYPGAVHHVMNRGVDHQAVFFSDVDRLDFGRQMSVIHERFAIDFLAYCLMGNHYHLLVRSNAGRLAEAMGHLATTYVRHVNDRLGRDGPLFRGRYRSKLVHTDPYFLWVTRYIHRNPLAFIETNRLSQYRWSSYPAYVGKRSRPAFLDASALLKTFHGDLEALEAFTSDRSMPLDGWRPDDLRQLVDLAIVEDELRTGSDTNHGRLVRTITALVSDLLPYPAFEVAPCAAAFGATPASWSRAVRRARNRASDPNVRRIASRVLTHLGFDDEHVPGPGMPEGVRHLLAVQDLDTTIGEPEGA